MVNFSIIEAADLSEIINEVITLILTTDISFTHENLFYNVYWSILWGTNYILYLSEIIKSYKTWT